jgi:hypothetical protein
MFGGPVAGQPLVCGLSSTGFIGLCARRILILVRLFHFYASSDIYRLMNLLDAMTETGK